MASRGDGLAVVDRWTAELHERVTETLRSVCGAFKQELELAAQPPAPPTADQVDYDTYNDCCQRLVQYIAANMDTSPYFTQQMDRIILACHSNTSEQVLGSLVTKDVWLRPRERTRGDRERNGQAPADTAQEATAMTPAPMVEGNPGGPIIKTEGNAVNASTPDKLPVQVEAAKPTTSRSRHRSVSSTRQDVEVAKAPLSSSSGISAKKRPSGRRSIMAAAPPAKRRRQGENHAVIEILSTADEEDGEVSDDEGRFGTETETEAEDEKDEEMIETVDSDDDNDADWVESASGGDDGDDSDTAVRESREANTREPIADVVGTLCHPENRSPQQTRTFRERLFKGIQFLDALLCRPSPGKVCWRNCHVLRKQWCRDIGPCRHKLCQCWHEVDAHVRCCQNVQCEYSIQVNLREAMHQIEHQHERISSVRRELDEKKKELIEANASRLTNPPSRISFLTEQVGLLEGELRSEQEQLEFYQSLERGNFEAAEEADINPLAGDFQMHYMVKPRSETTRADAGVHLNQDTNQVAPASRPVTEKDELLPSLADAIGKLCYAGHRTEAQTKLFKERLRKSIRFIDALLCKPPPGKICARDCEKIRENRCTKDEPCDNEMCGNWHLAEAHTDNCRNPQCEFKLRIILRETMHDIQKKQRLVQEERAKVQKKTLALEVIQRDGKSAKHYAESFSLVDTREQDRFYESKVLQDELDQLKGDLAKEEQLLQNFYDKRTELKEKLYTIGIDESDDVIDGFPEFTTHYEKKRGSRKQRAH